MKKPLQISLLSILTYICVSFVGLTHTTYISEYMATPPRSGGPAAILGADKTGSPLSNNTCVQCHGASNPNTTISIQIKNNLNQVVTEYVPNDSYSIEVTVSNSTYSLFGMQIVALSSTNMQAGAIGSPATSNTQVSLLGSIQYLEHLGAASNANNFTFTAPWTAPNSGTGTINFYGTGIGVDGSNSTSGDQVSPPISIQLTEVIPTTIAYSNPSFCENSINETPTITGTLGGVFTANPAGLNLNSATGEIDFLTSTIGNYTITYTTGIETATTVININLIYTTTDTYTLCDGDTYNFGAQILDASNIGVNTETFTSIGGCDSVVTLTLNVINPTINNILATICEGETYNFEGQILNASDIGLNTVILDNASANGCDSIINLTLSVTSIDNTISVINNSFMSNQNGATYQWLDCNGGTLTQIVDSTNQSLFPGNTDFSYAVEISFNGCVDTSDCLTQLSITDELLDLVTLYPNPSHTYIKIKGIEELKSITSMYILDINGKKVKIINNYNANIGINELLLGIYSLNIISQNGIKQIKFIKQ